MTGMDLFLLYALILVAMTLIALFIQSRLLRRRQEARRKAIIINMLEIAQSNNKGFDIVALDQDISDKSIPATLMTLDNSHLALETLSYVPSLLAGTKVDVYFQAPLPTGTVSYKFHAVIQTVESNKNKSRLRLTFPDEFMPGQRRKFFRIKPPTMQVRVVAIWNLDPAKPIPKNTGEIGRPLVHYKQGMDTAPVQVEDISATGIGLRFSLDTLTFSQEDLGKNTTILCLLIYNMPKEDRTVTFWCTAEVLHTRQDETCVPPVLRIGTIFTNWAVLEQGKSEISWFHSTPTRGVSPITQWVRYMDLERSKLLAGSATDK